MEKRNQDSKNKKQKKNKIFDPKIKITATKRKKVTKETPDSRDLNIFFFKKNELIRFFVDFFSKRPFVRQRQHNNTTTQHNNTATNNTTTQQHNTAPGDLPSQQLGKEKMDPYHHHRIGHYPSAPEITQAPRLYEHPNKSNVYAPPNARRSYGMGGRERGPQPQPQFNGNPSPNFYPPSSTSFYPPHHPSTSSIPSRTTGANSIPVGDPNFQSSSSSSSSSSGYHSEYFLSKV